MLSEKKSEKKKKKKNNQRISIFCLTCPQSFMKIRAIVQKLSCPKRTDKLSTRESDPYWLGKWLKPTNSEKLHLHYLN